MTEIKNAADALKYLIAHHKDRDLRMDRESSGGYTPALSLVANRIAEHFEERLDQMARTVRADAWTEPAYERSGRTFYVGFRDNRDASLYNTACAMLAVWARQEGWKTRVDAGTPEWACDTLHVTLPTCIEEYAQEIYGAYLTEIGKAPTK